MGLGDIRAKADGEIVSLARRFRENDDMSDAEVVESARQFCELMAAMTAMTCDGTCDFAPPGPLPARVPRIFRADELTGRQ